MSATVAPAAKGWRARSERKRRERMAKLRAKSGNRYRVHYDVDGPRVRLGVLWFVATLVALAVPTPFGVGLWFAGVAAIAAANAARAWHARGAAIDERAALVAASAPPLAAMAGPQAAGAAVLLLAVAAVVLPVVGSGSTPGVVAVLDRAGTFVRATLPFSLAATCLVLLADLEPWAVVSLVVLASAYEAGDYLVGSGAANAVEGPAAGIASVAVFTMVIAALGIRPFSALGDAFGFGLAAGIAAPIGQLIASVTLPHSRAYAPAVRRFDTYLLAAPLWYAGVDLLII